MLSNSTNEFGSPYDMIKSKEARQLTSDCANKTKKAVIPKYYSTNSGKTTDYVFIGLIGLCILIFAGMLLSNSVRQNKTRLTVVVITIAILITVFIALLYTTIHKK